MPPSKPNSRRWGEWSEWQWYETHGKWVRMRQDDSGQLDYDYKNQQPNYQQPSYQQPSYQQPNYQQPYESSTQNLQNIPRTAQQPLDPPQQDDIDEITHGVEVTNLSNSPDDPGRSDTNYTYQSDAIDKGKGPAQPSYYRPPADDEVEDPRSTPTPYSTRTEYPSGYAPAYGTTGRDEIEVEEEYEDDGNQAYGSYGGPSRAYGAPGYGTQDEAGFYQPDATTSSEYGVSNVNSTLDHRYGVQPSSEFQPGKILKVYWSEPKGRKAPTMSNRQEVFRLGELIYQGFRRFIVIANDQGHATCVPILTYESRGCAKPGVKAHKHGIIYDERKKPKPVSKEPELGFKPVRARMFDGTETLAKESRVNYSKTSSIEHNALVWFIGEVHPDDFRTVRKAHDKCWEKMYHGSGSGHRSHGNHRR